MRLRSEPGGLIGRVGELDALLAVIAADDGAVALLAGEPGIGKSRLVTEAIVRSARAPMIGTSSPASLGRPFDLLLSAVEPVVRWWSAIPASLGGVTAALTQLLRPVAPGLPHDERAPALVPADLIGAGIALLRDLAPELLVIEDLHWADIESLQVIERTLASPEHPPLLGTYRSEELDRDHPASELIRMIETPAPASSTSTSSRSVTTTSVPMWWPRRAMNLDERSLDRLAARTGGNPFFLEQLVDGGNLIDAETVPRTLSETIHRQLDTLNSPERDLVATAAILGSPFDFDLLATAAELEESTVIERLRSLVGRGVLVEDEVDVFRFRHELVREAAVGALLGRERRRLHDRSYQALVELHPDDYAELARHARGAERFDDLVAVAPEGVRHYLRAGSTFQALQLAKVALTELPGHPVLTELAARAAWMTGRLEYSRELTDRWLEYTRREEPEREHEALELLARLAFESGDAETQEQVIAELESSIDSSDDPLSQATVLAALAQHRMLRQESVEATELADRAIAIADEHGLEAVRRRALLEKYSAQMCVEHDASHAVDALERVAKDAEAVGDDLTAARAWHNVMSAQPPEDAELSLIRMRDAAIRCGFDSMAVNYYALKRVGLAVHRGDLSEARHWAGRSRLAGQRSTTGRYLAVVEAMLALESGDDDEARRLLDALPDVTPTTKKAARDAVESLRARLAARRGDIEAAVAHLAAMPNTDDLAGLFIVAFADLRSAGVPVDALRNHLERVGETNTYPPTAEIALALGAAAAGDPEARERLAAVADVPLRDAGDVAYPDANAVMIRAEALLTLAELSASADGTETGHAYARAALDLLERWPGTRRSRAVALLSTDVSGLSDGLTERELDVVRLVALGMSNGEIAADLFISRKTVSTHVSHVLTKLGMSSRIEVADWAIREGIAVGPGAG